MNQLDKKPVIGLLGGVGAGKSLVGAELVALGCVLIDGDAIGHELLASPEVASTLRQRWGERIFGADGRVNRSALGSVVFNDPRELSALNAIMQPAIRHHIEQQIAHAQADRHARAIVLDAAIMMEAGWDVLCDVLVFVEAPDSSRSARASARRGWNADTWRARENSQIPLDKKRQRCKYTLDNSFTVSRLREQVREILDRIFHDAADLP